VERGGTTTAEQTAPRRTNVPIDLAKALAAEPRTRSVSWQHDDVLLYNLATGAGTPPMDARELRFVAEKDLQVLPTFATVVPMLRSLVTPAVEWTGIDVDVACVLHASQRVEQLAPIPPSGSGTASERLATLYDKGSSALMAFETTVSDENGQPLWTSTMRMMARGEGGFGGERGPSVSTVRPDRAPDCVFDVPTLPQQALFYRLLGDRNPLHYDPEAAISAGFSGPILHGLCTYAMVLKGALRRLFDNDVPIVESYDATLRGVVFPGETIKISAWQSGGPVELHATILERDNIEVLSARLVAQTSNDR
jgi:acyl dehydratase